MGVVIPDTPDYGRPVPRGTTAVQSYAVAPPVQQDVAAWTYAANTAAGAANAEAKAFEGVGAELAKWGDQIETTQAQDALNQLRAKRQELTTGEQGFLTVKGDGVLKKGPDGQTIYEAFPMQLQTYVNDSGSKLMGRARLLFNQAAAAEVTGFKADVAKHGLNETERYRGAVFKDTQATLDNRIAAASDPAEVDMLIKSKVDSAKQYAASIGMPGEAAATAAASDAAMLVIQKAINTGDSAAAAAAVSTYGSRLDAKDRIKVDGLVKTLSVQDTARGQAQSWSSGLPDSAKAEEGTKASLKFWTADGYSKQVSAGITAGFLRESQFSPGAVNPKDGRDGSNSINIGQWNAARGQAFLGFAKQNGLDPNDVATGLKYAKAEIDGVIPYSVSGLSPAFKERLQNAKSEKEAADIMTRGYFRPLYQDGESAQRQRSASQILAKYGEVDPLQTAVDSASGVSPPKSGPQYVDTRQMLLDADQTYDAATRRNMEVNATNEAQRRATQSQLDLNLAAQKRQIEMVKLQLDMSVDKWMQTGGPNGTAATTRPPPEIWNQLHYEKQKSIDATILHNAKGVDPPFTADAKRKFMELSDMATNDPDKFRGVDLNEYVPTMPSAQILQLQTLKNQIQKSGQVEYDTKKATSMADQLLGMKGVDMRASGASDADVDVRQRTHAELLDWISRYQAEKKHKPTDKEVRDKLDDMLILGRTTQQKGFIARQFSSSEPKAFAGPPNAKGAVGDRGSRPGETFKFMVSPAEADKFFVPHDRIPADARKQIEDRIRSTVGVPSATDPDGAKFDDQEAFNRLVEKKYAEALAVMNKRGAKK